MEACRDLIPPTAVIRSRLASNIRERRLLRSLLTLSIQASEDGRPRADAGHGSETLPSRQDHAPAYRQGA